MSNILFLSKAGADTGAMAKAFADQSVSNGSLNSYACLGGGRVSKEATAILAELGLSVPEALGSDLSIVRSGTFDIVVTLDSEAREACPILPGFPVRVHWGVDRCVAGKAGRVQAQSELLRRLCADLFDRGFIEALMESRSCENLVLDNISDGIIAHDMDRRIFFFNKSAEQITGYTRGEALNRDCHEVFHGAFCGGQCALLERTEGGPLSMVGLELGICRKDGEPRRVRLNRSCIKDGDGKVVGYLASFRDITVEERLARRVGELHQFSGIIGRDTKMLALYDMIRDVADSNAPVLIQGESGTGKELVASALHNESPRSSKAFVAVNCGALPEALLESELFGHVRGAFTGAIRDKKGRFELADGGTIFLDEIGDISPAMQVKLLRVLQEGKFERVGSETTVQVDVRLVSATNKQISEEIRKGRFREDLYYRLSVVPIHLPPLRERRNDIPLLIEHILQRLLEERKSRDGSGGVVPVRVADAAMDILLDYEWPGNVRELQNWLQYALLKSRGGEIQAQHLPTNRHSVQRVPETVAGLAVRKRELLDEESVLRAMHETGGNKVEAAKILGVSRATLYRFLDRF